MANRKGLGVSKKFAKGTIHENATGRFLILDRFAEDDSNIPMLEFQWLSGEKEGQVEVNKEMNVNASIHKFQLSRGRPTIVQEPERIEDNLPFMEKIDTILEQMKHNGQFIEHFNNQLTLIVTMVSDQQRTIDSLMEQVQVLTERKNDLLAKQQEAMYKLIEKI